MSQWKWLLPTPSLPAWLLRCVRRHRSKHQNVYHCTVQKSASQWLRAILSDPRTFRHSGVRSHQYQEHLPERFDPRKLTERRFTQAMPTGTIATPIYSDYEGFVSIPKPTSYAAFFVMRDPRDVLISWYFSCKYSHPLMGEMEHVRQELNRLDETDGLLYALDYLDTFGLLTAQRSWVGASALDSQVLLLKYEDLIGADSLASFERLFAHCDIRMPRTELVALLAAHSFKALSGRERGDEDRHAHFRKGVHGDWRNHWSAALEARFAAVAGDVIQAWGYSG